MRVYIRRIKIKNETWFELIGHKHGQRVFLDYPGLKCIQNAGVEIMDADALLAECARNN